MPGHKGCQQRRGGSVGEKNRKGKFSEKTTSFHSEVSGGVELGDVLRRPRTVPDLLSGCKNVVLPEPDARPAKLTKLLLNVTIQRSLGAVHVLIQPESKVEDLIAAALRQYNKEGRRPILPANDPACFDLHYSQFSLESLFRDEKLINLGSRNFFLCPKPIIQETTSFSPCSKQAGKAVQNRSPWFKFMGFLL